MSSSSSHTRGKVTVAAVQMSMIENDEAANIATAVKLIRRAASMGGQVILLPELFTGHYFPKDQLPEHFELAQPLIDHPMIVSMQALARELEVVLPVSFYEREGLVLFNSVAIIDADGSILGVYRKSHIPDGCGYTEKYHFTPGNSGFKAWETRYGRLGVAICWDQWFPECARVMTLDGADLLLYPTAIGSEPPAPGYDSCGHWQRVQTGHAAANLIPVVASNRVGLEKGKNGTDITFYGSSFISDATGAIVAAGDRIEETVIVHTFDLDELWKQRIGWGVFRDRRPDLYSRLIK
jgi:N-carbamoylputrescine amidase